MSVLACTELLIYKHIFR